MDKFRITGGRALAGRVTISGAKNSALPCIAAAILTGETVTLHNVPYVRDCLTQRRVLEDLGATVLVPDLRTHKITAANVEVLEAPYDLVKTMRASVLALGPLVARFGKAKVSLPGGCAIGTRPIDMHLEALKLLGAQVHLEEGYVVARAPKGGRLVGADVKFPKVTVTGTENLLMAATLARGTTRLEGAAHARRSQSVRRGDRPVPGLPHGHAGAVHGLDDAGARALARHRDDLREPLHARLRDAAHGRGDTRRGAQHGGRRGAVGAFGRAR